MQFSDYYRNMYGASQAAAQPGAADWGAAVVPTAQATLQSAYKPAVQPNQAWQAAAAPAMTAGLQSAYKPAVQPASTVNPSALAAQQNAAAAMSNGGIWGAVGPTPDAWGAAAAPAMAANTSQPQGQTAAWQASQAGGMSQAANTSRGAQYSSSDIANYLRDQGLYQNGQIVNPEQVYERARLYGVSANQLDQALGLSAGTAQNWMDNYRNRRQP